MLYVVIDVGDYEIIPTIHLLPLLGSIQRTILHVQLLMPLKMSPIHYVPPNILIVMNNFIGLLML